VSGTTWVSQYQKGKTNLDLLEQEIVSGSGISWAISYATLHLTQTITIPASHHSKHMELNIINKKCTQRAQTSADLEDPDFGLWTPGSEA